MHHGIQLTQRTRFRRWLEHGSRQSAHGTLHNGRLVRLNNNIDTVDRLYFALFQGVLHSIGGVGRKGVHEAGLHCQLMNLNKRKPTVRTFCRFRGAHPFLFVLWIPFRDPESVSKFCTGQQITGLEFNPNAARRTTRHAYPTIAFSTTG